MPDHLELWFQELQKRRSTTIKSKIEVTGECDRPLGPHRQRAKIRIAVEPSDRFEVVDATQSGTPPRSRFLEWATFGLLDVLLVAESCPLKDVRITFEKLEIDDIHSSEMAFRHAGQDAARKILESKLGTAYKK